MPVNLPVVKMRPKRKRFVADDQQKTNGKLTGCMVPILFAAPSKPCIARAKRQRAIWRSEMEKKSIGQKDVPIVPSTVYIRKNSMKNVFFTIFFLMLSSLSLSANENMQSVPFFRASQNQPYHLSIGAVLFNQNGCIACHHFKEIFGYKEIYILMRESMENDETPLMTLHRGLKEEFGAIAQPIAFLGCLSGYLSDAHLSFEKTTLYVACQLIDWNPENRDLEDPEASSIIEWHEPDVLISLMELQGVRFDHRVDADESEVIKRALPYIEQSLNK